MQATKRQSAWSVAVCMRIQVHGDWRKASRGEMAAAYAEAKAPIGAFSVFPMMARLNLILLARDLAIRANQQAKQTT